MHLLPPPLGLAFVGIQYAGHRLIPSATRQGIRDAEGKSRRISGLLIVVRNSCANRLPRSHAGSPSAHLSKSNTTTWPARQRRFAGPKSPWTKDGAEGNGGASRSRASIALSREPASLGNRSQRSRTLGRTSSRTAFGKIVRVGAMGRACKVASVRPIAAKIFCVSCAIAVVIDSPDSYVNNKRRRGAWYARTLGTARQDST